MKSVSKKQKRLLLSRFFSLFQDKKKLEQLTSLLKKFNKKYEKMDKEEEMHIAKKLLSEL